MTTNVVSALAQKNRAFLNRAKPQRIGRERVAGLTFDGVNDFIQCPQTINISNDHSFSFWFRPNLYGGNQRLASTYINTVLGGITIGVFPLFSNPFTVYFNIASSTMGNDNCAIYATNSLPNALMHITIVKETQTRANWKIYVNGVRVEVTTLGVNNIVTGTVSGTPLTIGEQAGSFYLNASMYDVKIFNKAISQYEVRELFFKRGGVPQSFADGSMITDYRFDNFQRLALGILDDNTQNRNNGTLTNYTAGDLTAGSACKIVDRFGNPIRN